uniref:A18-like helicase n=1 Tax=Pithovirus LCPAC304 TaxID=2506594 RepID=A0A481ZA80_9VIRU|nr:MAG: A18-like helicase [Pithovirus LCPAC304]
MSVVVKRSALTEDQVHFIREMLVLQPKEKFHAYGKRKAKNVKPVVFYQMFASPNPEEKEEIYVFLPYRFAAALLGKNISEQHSYTPSIFHFTGTLRDYQEEDLPILVQHLDEYGTTSLCWDPGLGKCLAPGTKILMFDGTKKKVENVEVGDILMGDDSTQRHVLSTTSGMEAMYQIIPIKGEPFTVNKSHILTVWPSKQGIVHERRTKNGDVHFRVRWFDGVKMRSRTFHKRKEALLFSSETKKISIYDVALENYLKMSKTTRDLLKCLYVPVFYSAQSILLDPYFLGMWLGDGNSRGPHITNTDQEVIDYLKEFAKINDVNIKQKKQDPITYTLTGKVHGKNPILKQLQSLNLILNKHIPHIYKQNSVDVRLRLLAGLIDSDGWTNGTGSYEIAQKSDKLAEDIQDLCRSLGFACFTKKTMKYCWYKGEKRCGMYNIIRFYGDDAENIPVLIPRKRSKRTKNRNPLVTGFTVKPVGIGKYYGFTIDGNGRFLLGSFMVTHNTIMGAFLAAKYSLLTVVLTHRTPLIKQWRKTFAKVTDAQIWVVGEKKVPALFNVIICLDKRVKKIPVDIRNRVGMLIIDEAHAFCTISQVEGLLGFHPRYIIVATATLKRDDEMHHMIYAMCGNHNVTREFEKDFHVYKVETHISAVRIDRTDGGLGPQWHTLAKSLAFNDDRNNIIVQLVLKNPTYKIVILTGYVAHTKLLHKIFVGLKESVDYLCGPKKNYHDSRILVGTIDKIGTGFDEEAFCDDYGGIKINLGILAHSIASEKGLTQSVGRVFRAEFPNIMHLVDDDSTIDKHWKTAKRWYKSKGGILHETAQ